MVHGTLHKHRNIPDVRNKKQEHLWHKMRARTCYKLLEHRIAGGGSVQLDFSHSGVRGNDDSVALGKGRERRI